MFLAVHYYVINKEKARLHYRTGIIFQHKCFITTVLNFVTVMDLCFKNVLINITKYLLSLLSKLIS